MPAVRRVSVSDTTIAIDDVTGGVTRAFAFSALPGTQDTPAKAESYLNTVLSTLSNDNYACVCHVFRLPIAVNSIVIWCGPPGTTPIANWWVN